MNSNDISNTSTTTGLQYTSGEKITIKSKKQTNIISIIKKIDEGGFSFVYLVKEECIDEDNQEATASNLVSSTTKRLVSNANAIISSNKASCMVDEDNLIILKVTAIKSR